MDNQNKNLILASVLSFLVIVVWYAFVAPPEVPSTPVAPTAISQSQTDPAAPPAVADSTAAPASGAETTATELAAAPRISIDTPRLSGSISLLGGRIDDLSLKGYRETLADDSPNVRLLAPVGGTDLDAAKPYYAVYGWLPAGELDPALVPGAKTPWTVESGTTLAPGQPVTLAWNNGAGLIFRRQMDVDEDYLFTITQSVENATGAVVRLAPYGIVARHGQPDTQNFFVLHEGAVRMSDGKLQETDYDDIAGLAPVDREGQADVVSVTADGWIGFTDKYWMTTLAPMPGQAFTSVVKYAPGAEIYQAEARMPVMEVAPGASASVGSMLFAGAKEWETITGYEKNQGIKRFVDSIDWGWFYFLTKPMFWLLHWLNTNIAALAIPGSMGWAIIALTIVIKMAVFPLARKSYVSMAKMKELQPEMEKLKERFGEDRQKMQIEMMALYKREKVNPASGCLPIFLQIPIFFSLYKVIFVTIELRHAPWIGWIRDLSAPDPSSILNLFGLLSNPVPEPGSLFFIFSLGVLPILLGISMWFQQKLNPAPTDATQAMIFAWMPWVFMFMLGGFASGLVIYWIANNTITFIQQYTIMRMHGHPPDFFGNIRKSFKRKPEASKPRK
ncbi:membrane protein insertase YidC [Rhodobacter veldkampii DSM 11550]|uniref:Membrane protein insertase YidC n=1 Tax=Phaeovulum veldkampii DSM 11550 TaxID=1185920 RepID=A0A2T4JK02_9RHOB|nr:membrane protein insertase YidC [Phaeovulum veldkampii]MBK5946094.1 membrane protein insertase YidC [Phaeovulum veldkampii DSM 11550]PTE18193.1 membrane protein insertase YidC [Phaeovulum veldkampii DSM 11550]TDQ63506.1 protein translocase subunit yidC [Phaeovulum veldkampii DSM 11550]